MLSPTELMLSYQDFQDAKFSDNNRCPVKRTTRQVYRLLATALCLHSEPLLAQLLRGCLADSLKFSSPQAALIPANEGFTSPRSEKATIAALDLPVTLRHFPAGTGCCDAATYQASPLATGDLASRFGGTRCEKMLESRLREIYFPRRSAQLLVDWQLRECLSAVMSKAVGRLFARIFTTANSEGTPVETSSSSELAGSIASSEDQQLTQQRQTPGTGTVAAAAVRSATAAVATSATAATAALNTDGSNSFRQHKHQTHQQPQQQQRQQQRQQQLTNRHQTHWDQAQQQQQQQQPQQQQQQQPTDSAASTTGSGSSQQRLCRLHANGSTRQTHAGESSCAVCAARHFLQQHLNRISGDPQNLAKLERTLRDCMQLQSHWCRSLQWIAANVKESRLPEFVRPLVNTWYSDDGFGRSVTVNPQIIIKTDRHVSTKYNWDIKKSDSA